MGMNNIQVAVVTPTSNSELRFGLSAEIREAIIDVLMRYSDIDRVVLFGSRARGNFRPESDIDIAVVAPKLSDSNFAQLWNELDDLPLAFKLDVLHFERVTSASLSEKIQRDSVSFYDPEISIR